MKDNELRQHVIDELEFEPSIDAANVGVAVEDGVVTLSGHVTSYVEKLTENATERAAWCVPGVHAVRDDLAVG